MASSKPPRERRHMPEAPTADDPVLKSIMSAMAAIKEYGAPELKEMAADPKLPERERKIIEAFSGVMDNLTEAIAKGPPRRHRRTTSDSGLSRSVRHSSRGDVGDVPTRHSSRDDSAVPVAADPIATSSRHSSKHHHSSRVREHSHEGKVRGEHSRGEHSRGEHSRGEHSRGEHSFGGLSREASLEPGSRESRSERHVRYGRLPQKASVTEVPKAGVE